MKLAWLSQSLINTSSEPSELVTFPWSSTGYTTSVILPKTRLQVLILIITSLTRGDYQGWYQPFDVSPHSTCHSKMCWRCLRSKPSTKTESDSPDSFHNTTAEVRNLEDSWVVNTNLVYYHGYRESWGNYTGNRSSDFYWHLKNRLVVLHSSLI